MDWNPEPKTTVKECEKYLENIRHLGHHEKTKPTNHGYRRRRRDTN
jgi:hypothetical protein